MEYISTLQLISIHRNKLSAEAVQETLIRFAEKLPKAGKGGPVDCDPHGQHRIFRLIPPQRSFVVSRHLQDILLEQEARRERLSSQDKCRKGLRRSIGPCGVLSSRSK
jgi:hypothetical protein